ncbi:unnamed protein product [Prunus brigantina]
MEDFRGCRGQLTTLAPLWIRPWVYVWHDGFGGGSSPTNREFIIVAVTTII